MHPHVLCNGSTIRSLRWFQASQRAHLVLLLQSSDALQPFGGYSVQRYSYDPLTHNCHPIAKSTHLSEAQAKQEFKKACLHVEQHHPEFKEPNALNAQPIYRAMKDGDLNKSGMNLFLKFIVEKETIVVAYQDYLILSGLAQDSSDNIVNAYKRQLDIKNILDNISEEPISQQHIEMAFSSAQKCLSQSELGPFAFLGHRDEHGQALQGLPFFDKEAIKPRM